MYVAQIYYPGTFLNVKDRDKFFELEGILSMLEDRVVIAAIGLSLYESSQKTSGYSVQDHERDTQIRKELSDQIRSDAGDRFLENFETYQIDLDRRTLERKKELGIVPRSYSHKIPFVHAHTFVFAIDSFASFLTELCDYSVVPNEVREAREKFNFRLPVIRKIRNSAIHAEDRLRRFASSADKRKGKRMDAKMILLGNLEGNSLCYTIDDGSYQKISISAATLSILTESLNEVLGAMPWTGPPRISPT